MKIDYKEDAETVRWPRMLAELEKLPIKERRMILWKATSYSSGEDSCNSVYMGGIAHARLRQALGDSYPGTKQYRELIWGVDEDTLMKGLRAAAHTVEYMLAHPRKRCVCCGQIIPEDAE